MFNLFMNNTKRVCKFAIEIGKLIKQKAKKNYLNKISSHSLCVFVTKNLFFFHITKIIYMRKI